MNLSALVHLPLKVQRLPTKLGDATRQKIRQLNPWDQQVFF